MKRKMLSYLLVLVLMFQIMPVNVIALDDSTIADGTCGSNLTWILYDNGELVISGEGAMESSAPWLSSRSRIQSVTIGESVTSIGNDAFYGCTGLTEITIPENVTSIGNSAFSHCTGLTQITIPENVTSIGNYAFYNCTGLTSVTIPNSVTSIGGSAFEGCTGLTSVTIPDSVTSIGNYAFWGCAGLTEITIPENVTSIGSSAFGYCTGLTEINYNAKAANDSTFSSDVFYNAGKSGSGITVTFGDSVEKIPANLFRVSNSSYSPKIASVTIGKNVTSIGNYAFYYCKGLTSVTIPDSVTSIGDCAFEYCTGLTEINYNAKAANDLTFSSDVFYNAGKSGSGISVTFGEKVKKVPAYLFSDYRYYTSNIKGITFTGNAPTIGDGAFGYLTSWAYYPYGNTTWTSSVRQNYGGTITWRAYSNAEVTGCECSISKKSYVIGDDLSTSGISMKLTHIDGCVETFEYATGKLSLGSYDMTKPGRQSIEVTCKGETASFDIYIHGISEETQDKSGYPESTHPYEDNFDHTYTYTVPDAFSLKVTFSASTMVETNVDYIYINGIRYTGNELADKTVEISGNTLEIRLVSDSTDTEYGFSIAKIEALIAVHEYTEQIIASTCKDCGVKIYTCSVCGYSKTETIPLSSNHSYQETWSFDGITHWHECSVCQDKKDIETHSGGIATCNQKAICEECGVEYGDYAKHKLTKHEKVEPTVDNDGNIEYWTCDGCGKYFSDAEGKYEIAKDDIIIGKLTIKKLTYLDGEVLIEVPSNAVPEDFEITVDKIVPPPAEIVEKVKDTYGESSEVLAYYEIRLFDENGVQIYNLNSEITIKSILSEKYRTGYIIKISQEDDDGNLVEMESWREGEYICYKTNWLEKY